MKPETDIAYSVYKMLYDVADGWTWAYLAWAMIAGIASILLLAMAPRSR